MITPNVINTARRTILKIKREDKNVVAPMIKKKSTIVQTLSGVNVFINHPRTLKPDIPTISHQTLRGLRYME